MSELINRTVMSHLDDGLELLDNTSLWSVDVSFHVSFREEISFVFYVINNSDLFTALLTVVNSVVKYWSIKPSSIVNNNFLVLLFIIDFVGKIIGLVQFCLIDDNFFWVVGNFYAWFWKVVIWTLCVISVSDVEFKVVPTILKYQNWNLILSEHH